MRIKVDGLESIEKEELLYLMGLEVGKPLADSDISEGIKRAFLKGIFEEISVEVDDSAPDILIVRVRERVLIEEIDIEGTRDVSKGFIRKHIGLSEGQHLRYDILSTVKHNIEELFAEKGYPDAVVGFQVKPTRIPYRVRFIVNVDESAPMIIKKVNICGDEKVHPIARDRLERFSGAVFDQILLRESIKKVREKLRGQGYIEPIVGPYTFDQGLLDICVNLGKRLAVSFSGNAKVPTNELKKRISFGKGGEIREDMILESVARMYSLYHEKGFINTQIAPFLSENENEISIDFFVYEGNRAIVESVSITGTDLPENRLKGIVSLRRGVPYNPEVLSSDSRRLRDFLIALGYYEAQVDDPKTYIEDVPVSEQSQTTIYEGFDKKVSISININPGSQVLISSVEVKGAQLVPREEVLDAVMIRKGDPYNEVDISDALRRSMNVCRSYGFYYCDVEVERELSQDGIALVFEVQEGPKLFVGRTVVRGNYDTKLEVIDRELQYEEEMPLDREKFERTRRRLYKLNLFSQVNIEAMDARDDKADVLIDLKEGRPGTVEFGFGYGEYEQYRGFFDIGYRNLFGMNREGSLRTEFSSLSSRYIATFREPWFLGKPIVSRTFVLHESRKEKNIDTDEIRYRIKKYTASTGLEKQLAEKVKGTLYYEYTVVDTFDLKPDVILSREDTGTLAISSLTPGIVYDTRDDPFDPRKGLFAGLAVKYASQMFVSETDFVKVTSQMSMFHSVTPRLVLAGALRGGASKGFRDTKELPLVERFFLGGRSTVRGYDQDTLGPKGDEGTPLGGNYFALGNLELRYRLTGNWRVVIFTDGGYVWVLEQDISGDDLRYTAGLGLQYNTPVGPIRLDYGHKLNRQPGESRGEFHFSIGHAF